MNEAPLIVFPGAQVTNEDTPVVISGITYSDPDIESGNLFLSFSSAYYLQLFMLKKIVLNLMFILECLISVILVKNQH